MSRVFWDTNLFIYLFEGAEDLSDRVATLRERMRSRNDQLYTSAVTLGEVLVKPLERRDQSLREKYERVLQATAVVVPFDAAAGRIYASIRRDRSLKAPDAIQLACAAQSQVDLFITNDERLSQKIIPGIHFIVSLHKAFF